MTAHRVAARILREDSTDRADVGAPLFWLNQSRVSEAVLWEAVRARVAADSGESRIPALLSDARKSSGMDSTFLVADNTITHCVNGGPLKLVAGQHLGWFARVSEELDAANTWHTHALDAERADASLGLPLRVKTLFVLPIAQSGRAAATSLCGISQIRVVLDRAQLEALNQLPILLGRDCGGLATASGGSTRARKSGRRVVFGHVFGGRDAVTKRIAGG